MIPCFDAHCDTALSVHTHAASLYENRFHLDLKRIGAYAPCAQVFAVWTEHGEQAEITARADAVLSTLLQELDANRGTVCLCRSAADVARSAREGRIAALISVEGAERLDCSVERLRAAYERGVRIVHLCWNHDNALTGSATDSGSGLTAEGTAFAAAAQDLGAVLDMSHISERGFWDVLALAEKPVLAGHSNAAALCPHPRNLTDAQFTALVRAGGVAGLNYYPKFLGLTRDITPSSLTRSTGSPSAGRKRSASAATSTASRPCPPG